MATTGRRTPPSVPLGSAPSPAMVWKLLIQLWTYVFHSHRGIPGGFFGIPTENIVAGADEPDLGEEANGWAAANHSHTINTAAPSNPTGTAADEGSGPDLMRADATIMQGIVTTKGDVLTHNATVPDRLAVGANDTVLTAASAQTTGLSWRTVASLIASVLTAKGDILTHNGTTAVRKAVGANTYTIVADSTVTEGWKWAAGLSWTKYTFTHTQLQAAAMANDVELFSLPAGGIVHSVKIKHSVIFAGTGLTDYKLSVGIVGTLNKYASSFDVDTAVTSTNFQLSTTIGSEDHGAATSIRLAATSAGANLDQSATGSVEIWVLASVAV